MPEVVLAGDLRVSAVVKVPGDDHARRVEDDKRDERRLRAAGRAYGVFLGLRDDETAVRGYRSGEAEHEGAILPTLPAASAFAPSPPSSTSRTRSVRKMVGIIR